jgi:hypothetical protein
MPSVTGWGLELNEAGIAAHPPLKKTSARGERIKGI